MSDTIETPTGALVTVACGPFGKVHLEVRSVQVGRPDLPVAHVMCNLSEVDAWRLVREVAVRCRVWLPREYPGPCIMQPVAWGPFG